MRIDEGGAIRDAKPMLARGQQIGAGPLLSIFGIAVWGVLWLVPWFVWRGYEQQTDILAFDYLSRGLISAILLLAGSGVCFSLSAIGTILSLGQWNRRADSPAILGIVLGVVGLLPTAWVVVRLGFGV